MECRGRLRKLIVLFAGMAATLSFSDAQESCQDGNRTSPEFLASGFIPNSFPGRERLGSARERGCGRIDCGDDFGGRNPEVVLFRDRSSHVSDGHEVFVSGRQGNDGFHREHPQRQPPEIFRSHLQPCCSSPAGRKRTSAGSSPMPSTISKSIFEAPTTRSWRRKRCTDFIY